MAHEAISRQLFERDVAVLSDKVAKEMDVVVNSREFPILDVTINHKVPLRLKFICNNWNDAPPSIELLTSDGSRFSGTMPGGIFHPNRFICMPGSLEYYTLGRHSEPWENYKNQPGMTIVGIFLQIKNAWRQANHPA